ncbi:MAG: sterol desaturase family protein [Bacteroidales bacterium]|nr:sterol desaturase family protein [Bacteroidales bacterium]
MDTLISILLILGAFLFMEFMAWFTHKYVMHGFLWILHKDHHIRDGRKVEWNDVFAIIFALPSILLIYLGVMNPDLYLLSIGLGIALYGFSYFMFHDVYVHQRVKILSRLSNRYLRATVKAHKEHHNPHAHYNYGFLIAPFRYYKEEFGRKS